MTNLKDNERIDDLQCKGYKIIQNKDMFCFGMDAVLLANYVSQKPSNKCIDLGTGTGIIPILMSAKEPGFDRDVYEKSLNDTDHEIEPKYIGIEIQEACSEMATRSVVMNSLSERVRIDLGDIKEVSCNYKKASFDIVTSNPPYIKGNHGLTNPGEPKNIARHEILVNLEEIVQAADYLLKPGGSFYMIHKPFRLAEIFATFAKYKLEPKRMQLIHPYAHKEPNMVIIQGVKGGNSMIKIDPPLIVYKEPGVYTEQLLKTYYENEICE